MNHQVMRRLKAAGGALAVVGLALFPAFGAMIELGDGLARVERMNRSADVPSIVESIGTYEADPPQVRFHSMRVLRN